MENHEEIKTLMDFPVGYICFNSAKGLGEFSRKRAKQ